MIFVLPEGPENYEGYKYNGRYYACKKVGIEKEVKERVCLKCDSKFLSVDGKRFCTRCTRNAKNSSKNKKWK